MIATSQGFILAELPGIEMYLAAPSDVAFVSGSQQAGLGNRTSDFDLYIVYRDDLHRLKDGPKQFWLRSPDRRVDLERHSWQEISEAADRINAITAPAPVRVSSLAFDDLDLYYRTAVGSPMANEAGFRELTARLDTAHYDAVFAAWSLWQAGLRLARARQRLAEGRTETAYAQARLAVRHAVTAAMARIGAGWPNPKWAFVKLERHAGRDSLEYRRAWDLNGLGSRDMATYMGQCSAFCEEHGAPRLEPPAKGEAVYALRGESLNVAIAGRRYLVHGRRDVFEVDDAAAAICALVDGKRPVREIAVAFAAQFSVQEPLALHRVGEFLARLTALGIAARRDEFVQVEEASRGSH